MKRRRRRFDAKIKHFCSSWEAERDALDNPRHIRIWDGGRCAPPPGFMCRAGRTAGSIPLGLCMSPFVLVSTGEEKKRGKKKSFFPLICALRLLLRALWRRRRYGYFFLFFDTREKKREGRCKVKVESCGGDYRTDGSVNFEFCWPFYFCRTRKREREKGHHVTSLTHFRLWRHFFRLKFFFGFLWENSRLYLKQLWYKQGFPAR